jgi:hypothetical protein
VVASLDCAVAVVSVLLAPPPQAVSAAAVRRLRVQVRRVLRMAGVLL